MEPTENSPSPNKIIKVDWKSMPREEAVKLAMDELEICREEADFFVALQRGETTGEDIIIDENGNKIIEVYDAEEPET